MGKRLLAFIAFMSIMSAPVLADPGNGHGHGHGKDRDRGTVTFIDQDGHGGHGNRGRHRGWYKGAPWGPPGQRWERRQDCDRDDSWEGGHYIWNYPNQNYQWWPGRCVRAPWPGAQYQNGTWQLVNGLYQLIGGGWIR